MEGSTVVVMALLSLLIGFTVGWAIAYPWAKAKAQVEMMDTYRHLLDYGRTEMPKAIVKEEPATVDEIATVRIGETARNNLTEHLAREAGVSHEKAREEADRLVGQLETWGQNTPL